MGNNLFDKWLEEEVVDVNLALLLYGVVGMLSEFESWLRQNNYLIEE